MSDSWDTAVGVWSTEVDIWNTYYEVLDAVAVAVASFSPAAQSGLSFSGNVSAQVGFTPSASASLLVAEGLVLGDSLGFSLTANPIISQLMTAPDISLTQSWPTAGGLSGNWTEDAPSSGLWTKDNPITGGWN